MFKTEICASYKLTIFMTYMYGKCFLTNINMFNNKFQGKWLYLHHNTKINHTDIDIDFNPILLTTEKIIRKVDYPPFQNGKLTNKIITWKKYFSSALPLSKSLITLQNTRRKIKILKFKSTSSKINSKLTQIDNRVA